MLLKLTLCPLLSLSTFLKSQSCHHSPGNERGRVHHALFTLWTIAPFLPPCPYKGPFPLSQLSLVLGPTYTAEVVRGSADLLGSSWKAKSYSKRKDFYIFKYSLKFFLQSRNWTAFPKTNLGIQDSTFGTLI